MVITAIECKPGHPRVSTRACSMLYVQTTLLTLATAAETEREEVRHTREKAMLGATVTKKSQL